MQILIAGGTGCGKTTLALEISKRLNSYIISTSDIREALRTTVSEKDAPELFHSTYRLGAEIFNNSHEALLENQAVRIVKATAAILNRHKLDKASYIAEGIHILPSILKDLTLEHFIVLVLHPPSKETHLRWLRNRARIDAAKPVSKYKSFFEVVRDLGEYIPDAWLKTQLGSSQLKVIYNVDENTDRILEFLEKIHNEE